MMQPMYDGGFSWLGVGIIAVGIVGLVLGFATIRWVFRDEDEDADFWRSHRRR